MKKLRSKQAAAMLAALALSTGTAAFAANQDGGYYYSLSHPDFGQNVEQESRYRPDDGYYAFIQPNPTSAASPGAEPAQDQPAQTGDAAKQAVQTIADKAYALQQAAQDAQRQADEARALLETAVKAQDAAQAAAQAAVLKASALPATITDKLPVTDTPASFNTLMNAGRDEFRQQAYHAARDTFAQTAAMQPMNQDAHFWLAMAYWHLYDYDNTKQQLELSFRLNPFDTEGQVAKSRLPDISAFLDNQGRPPVDSADQLQQTLSDLSHQSASLRAQKFMDGEAMANSRTQLAATEAGKITKQTNQYLRSAEADGRYFGYEPDNLDEVSDLGYIHAHYAITDGFVQSTAARTDAANRQQNIADWQNYMLSALGDRPQPGHPRLRAFGTSLYAQYYGDEDAQNPPLVAVADPALKAIALKYQPPLGAQKATLLEQAYRYLKKPTDK